jgi:hypothetical protein
VAFQPRQRRVSGLLRKRTHYGFQSTSAPSSVYGAHNEGKRWTTSALTLVS